MTNITEPKPEDLASVIVGEENDNINPTGIKLYTGSVWACNNYIDNSGCIHKYQEGIAIVCGEWVDWGWGWEQLQQLKEE